MGFSFSFGKKRKMRKLIGNYVSDRVREKKAFDEQMKRLDAQLQDETIEQVTYERLRDVLEAKFYQQKQEQWAKIKNQFFNPINS